MNNFNLNNININRQITPQNAGAVQNNQNSQNNQNVLQTPQYYTPLPQATPLYNNPIVMPGMENDVILNYLQNLLNLPETIDEFISQMNKSENINPKLAKLLTENLISVKSLNQFLNENSKEAVLKVIDTISCSLKSGISDVSDLKTVLGILNTIQANSKDISSNTIKELLLLYIPLSLPIYEKKTEFGNLSSEQEEQIKENALNILFETINFSNIMVSIEESDMGAFLYLYSTKSFPKERFEKIIKTLLEKANIKVIIEYHETKEGEKTNKTQNFSIISNDYIKPDTLLISHIVIKTILKIDNDFT